MAALLATLGLLTGHLLLQQRALDHSEPRLRIGGDTNQYVRMIEQGDDASAPFRYRLLIPVLARCLPMSAVEALRLLTYAALWLTYIFLFLTCYHFTSNLLAAGVGVWVIFTGMWHLYIYHNPYLVDAPALLALSVLLWAVVRERFRVFLVACTLGVLCRESVLALAPAWFLVHGRRKGALAILVSVATYLTVYLHVGASDKSWQIVSGDWFAMRDRMMVDGFWLRQLQDCYFWTWGWAWILTLSGVLLWRRKGRSVLIFPLLLLVTGSFLASLLATDTGRMFLFVAPSIALCSAALVASQPIRLQVWWLPLLLGALALNAMFALPNNVFGVPSRVFPSYVPWWFVQHRLWWVACVPVVAFVAMRQRWLCGFGWNRAFAGLPDEQVMPLDPGHGPGNASRC